MPEKEPNHETEPSTATALARSLYERSLRLSFVQQAELGIHYDKASATGKLRAFGQLGDREAYQTLSHSEDGMWHFSTAFMEEGGEHVQHHFKDGSAEDADLEVITALRESIFVQKLG